MTKLGFYDAQQASAMKRADIQAKVSQFTGSIREWELSW